MQCSVWQLPHMHTRNSFCLWFNWQQSLAKTISTVPSLSEQVDVACHRLHFPWTTKSISTANVNSRDSRTFCGFNFCPLHINFNGFHLWSIIFIIRHKTTTRLDIIKPQAKQKHYLRAISLGGLSNRLNCKITTVNDNLQWLKPGI